MIWYARKKKGLPQNEWQTLDEHANSVAKIAASLASQFGGTKWAHAAGLLHDLGKARQPFLDMLIGKRAKDTETQHAKYGAAAAFAESSLPVAFAIGGHHAGLHDLDGLQKMVENVDATEFLHGTAIPTENDLPFKASENSVLALEYFTRMLFSCLVDADRLDAARWEKSAETGEPSTYGSQTLLNPTALLGLVLAERDRKREANPASAMASARNAIFDACVLAGEQPQGFFSLTVPTGGGKTLSGMAFALAHAKKHNLRRVIVVIPYLSIIEQNATEYRSILDPLKQDIVLECHSSVKPRGNVSLEEVSRIELISENWDAPVIITTSVQFLESLFAASPSRARKLHNIVNSVVIFDEVQTLPTHLIKPILSVFRELTSNYGVSFVFSSATQPAFLKTPSLPDGFESYEVLEIAPDPSLIYKSLRRVNYIFDPIPIGWETLAEQLMQEPQCLCVVNLTRHARELWDKLNDLCGCSTPKPIHLSSAMCPAHRLAIIRHIRLALKAGKPCRVVSTQLIEAGVDVDFPAVWRAIGPLDSIVQVAGRCNREGKSTHGTVRVFTPSENKLPAGGYSTATGQAANTLAGIGTNAADRIAEDPSLFTEYFASLYQLIDTDKCNIQNDRSLFRFRTVSENATVIDDSGTPVVIPIGRARHVIAEIQSRSEREPEKPRFSRNDMRRLQRYMVNLHSKDILFFEQRGLLKPMLPNLELFVLDCAQYNRHLGVIKSDQFHPLEEYLS